MPLPDPEPPKCNPLTSNLNRPTGTAAVLLPLLHWAGGGPWGGRDMGKWGRRSGRPAPRTLAADGGQTGCGLLLRRRTGVDAKGGGEAWTAHDTLAGAGAGGAGGVRMKVLRGGAMSFKH